MSKVFAFIFLFFFSFASLASDTEWVSFKGKVVDAKDNSVLIGAKVIIGETGIVAYTAPDGTFKIDVPLHELKNIRIEYISYQDLKVKSQDFKEDFVFRMTSH